MPSHQQGRARIAAGKKLKSSPRFAAFDSDDPLPQFRGQVDFVNFDGLLGFRENISVKDGGKDSPFGLLKMLTEMPPKDPTGMRAGPTRTRALGSASCHSARCRLWPPLGDELWLYHVPTRSVFAGENLGSTRITIRSRPSGVSRAFLWMFIRSSEESLKSRNLSFFAQGRMDNILKAHT